MPDQVITQSCTYAGVADFEGATYTAMHGLKPGVVLATTRFPADAAPPFGDFAMTDGQRTLVLRDCKLARLETVIDDTGHLYRLTLEDRAHRWRTGAISGHYNQLDDRGNLIKPTVKTGAELAALCLKAMGETSWGPLDFPSGVKAAAVETVGEVDPGVKSPPTNSNPEVRWVDKNPADALAELADVFGLRPMFCPVADVVSVRRPGDGAALPVNDFSDTVTLGLEAPATPAGVGVVGPPVKYQMKLRLVPVAKEWHSGYVDADKVSYRPDREPQPGKWYVNISTTGPGPFSMSVSLNLIYAGQATAANAAALASALCDAILTTTDPRLFGVFKIGYDGGTRLLIEGVQPGEDIAIAPVAGPGVNFTTGTDQLPTKSCWDLEVKGQWYGVRPTDRLDYDQARELAVESVGRCFRIADDDVSNGWGKVDEPKPIYVPFYGTVKWRKNLVLLPTKVEQVRPEPPDPGRVRNDANAVLAAQPEYYDGFSRDQQASVYGSVCNLCRGRWWNAGSLVNSRPGSLVGVPCTVDPLNQLVVFPQPVYKAFPQPGRDVVCRFPHLVLETGVLVKDGKTFAEERYRRWCEFGPQEKSGPNAPQPVQIELWKYGVPAAKPVKQLQPKRKTNVGSTDTPPPGVEWFGHDDAACGVIGRYYYDSAKDVWQMSTRGELDPEDVSEQVADYYLTGHLLQHAVTGGYTVGYFGLQLVPLDGAVSQVSWSIGPRAYTTASRNQEHGVFVLPYPARRREEFAVEYAARTRANLESARVRRDLLDPARIGPARLNK